MLASAAKPTLFVISLLLLSCASTTEPEFGTIDWYLSNGTGSGMTLVILDRVCNRTHNRINLPRTGQVPMTTCKDSAGRANIRYRRSSRISDGNPWREAIMTPNQALIVR